MAGATKKPRIVPPKGFTAVKQADFVANVREGADRTSAATGIGMKPRLIHDFIANSDDFRGKVEKAELVAVEQALFKAGMEGKTVALKTWLEFRGAKSPTGMGDGLQPGKEEAPAKPEEGIMAMSNVTELRGTGRKVG